MSFSSTLRPMVIADSSMDGVQAGTKKISADKAEKVKKYAKEFEANLLGNLYKDMQHSLGGAPDDSDPGADTLTDMGVHALSMGVVAGGGIGIANLLIQHLIPKGAAADVTNGKK